MSDYSGSIVIPESVVYKEKTYKVTRIGQQAFFCCEDVISITIPKSVNVIRHYAFAGCSNLTEIVCKAHNPPATRYIDKVGFDRPGGVFYGVNKQNCKLYVPKGCEEAYRASDLWKDFNIVEMEMGIDEVKSEESLTPNPISERG